MGEVDNAPGELELLGVGQVVHEHPTDVGGPAIGSMRRGLRGRVLPTAQTESPRRGAPPANVLVPGTVTPLP